MLEFFTRLDFFMSYSGLNDNRVTVECEISNGLIGKARKRGSLSQDNISRILKKYNNLDANWLMTGKGEMIIESIDQDLKSIPIIKIENVINFKNKKISKSLSHKDNKFVPSNLMSADFLVELSNKSTSQKYNNGDFLACKKLEIKEVFYQWNNVFILDTKFGIWIKKLVKGKDDSHLLILSENPNHDPFEIRVSEINAIAVVLGVVKLE